MRLVEVEIDAHIVTARSIDELNLGEDGNPAIGARHLYAKLGEDPEDLIRRSFTEGDPEVEIQLWLEEVSLRLKEKILGW